MGKKRVIAAGVATCLVLVGCGPTKTLAPTSSGSSNSNNIAASNDVAVPTAANSTVTGYIYDAPKYVMYINWTESDSTLTGTFQEAYEDSNQHMQTFSSNITGVINDSNFSITLSARGVTYTGTKGRNQLSLVVPMQDGTMQTLVFSPGDINTYNADVQQIQGGAAADQQATASAQQEAATRSSIDKLIATVNQEINALNNVSLSSDLSAISDSLKDEQDKLNTTYGDLQKVLAEAPSHPDSLSYDAGVVNYDAGAVNYDYTSITGYDMNNFNNDVDSINGTISNLQKNSQALDDEMASDPSYEPTIPSPGTIQNAIAHAQSVVQSATKTANGYVASATSLNNKAQSYSDQAEKVNN